jgi:hypothetical protein
MLYYLHTFLELATTTGCKMLAPCVTDPNNQLKLDNGIRCIKWTPQSTDLNPIENLWKVVKNGLSHHQPQNLRELEAAVADFRNNILGRRCRRLIRSMLRRIQAVIDAHGGYTKY